MKISLIGAAATAVWLVLIPANPALAEDKPLFGPIPEWVASTPDPPAAGLGAKVNAAMVRFDEQVFVDGATVTAFVDTITPITSPEILNKVGTISISWNPQHGSLTFHRIELLRGDERIDMLRGGEGFTVLRREAGLERMEVSGTLTAVKQLEGLRVGDSLRMAISVAESDKTLAGHLQDNLVLIPAPIKLSFGQARLVWPNDRKIVWKPMMPGITATPRQIGGNRTELVVPLPSAKMPEMPKNMPTRFQPLSLIQFTTFQSWDEVKAVMAPLYAAKGTIVDGSDLARRADAIAAGSADPVVRMAEALRMVQDDVRYQLVTLGNGNYVPQSPTETWAKRYGDCKAKTVLLLAVFDRLGIRAEPTLANTKRGDAVGEMLPSAMAFDHVFVRAQVGHETFWLDPTMLGSRFSDIRNVPRYGKVLPLFDSKAALVDLPRRANARPDLEGVVAYDMSAGPHLPAPYQLNLRYGGQLAVDNKIEGGGDAEERLRTFAEKAADEWTGSDTIGTVKADYDAEKAIWSIEVAGVAYPDWKFRNKRYDFSFQPKLKVNFDAPRGRSSWQKIPALIASPWTARTKVVYELPDGGKNTSLSGSEINHLSLPAIDWQRKVSLAGGRLTEEVDSLESGVEIAPEQVSATAKAITDAVEKSVHLSLPASYPQRWDDVPRMRGTPAVSKIQAIFDQRVSEKPEDAQRLMDRGWLAERLLNRAKAEADYTKAIALDATAARHVRRSNLRRESGDHAGSLKDAQVAYDLEQGNADARNRLAMELAYAGRTDEAVELLTTDPDIATDDGLSHFLFRGEVLMIGGKPDDALAELDNALEKQPRQARLRNARCWHKALGNLDLDAALADCNQAIELAANPSAYLDSRALVHFRAGRLAEALADYEAALAESPDQSSSLYMSGLVLARMGKSERAKVQIAAARSIYPEISNYYARFGLKP